MKNLLIIYFCFVAFLGISQKIKTEKGRFQNNTIQSSKPAINNYKAGSDEWQLDGDEDRTTNLHFAQQFQPLKEIKEIPIVMKKDTTEPVKIGEPTQVEAQEEIKIGDDWVKAAEYFTLWDPNVIDPYNVDPREFNDVITLQLYDESHKWAMPLDKMMVTSPFYFRWGRWHTGIDFRVDTGDPVKTSFDGLVRVVGWDGYGYGRYIVVRHWNGLETLYGHLSKQEVVSGQVVTAGDIIGLAGSTGRSTGPHLHFETRYQGDAFDPSLIFDFNQQDIRYQTFLLTSRAYDYVRGRSASYEYEESNPLKVYRPQARSGTYNAYRKSYYYKVRAGETLYSIATRHGLSVSGLAARNGINPQSILRVGMRLKLR